MWLRTVRALQTSFTWAFIQRVLSDNDHRQWAYGFDQGLIQTFSLGVLPFRSSPLPHIPLSRPKPFFAVTQLLLSLRKVFVLEDPWGPIYKSLSLYACSRAPSPCPRKSLTTSPSGLSGDWLTVNYCGFFQTGAAGGLNGTDLMQTKKRTGNMNETTSFWVCCWLIGCVYRSRVGICYL